MPSIDDLGDDARMAYQAFVDMGHSKAAHFSCLQAIDSVYEAGGAPGMREKLELEKLLAIHDKNVLAFKTAMAAITDESERQMLIALMS